jgi:hypothetical protein
MWEDVKVSVAMSARSFPVTDKKNDLTTRFAITYKDGWYFKSDYLVPGEGYWVKNIRWHPVVLYIPKPGVVMKAGKGSGSLGLRPLSANEEKPPAPPGGFDLRGGSSGGAGCHIEQTRDRGDKGQGLIILSLAFLGAWLLQRLIRRAHCLC